MTGFAAELVIAGAVAILLLYQLISYPGMPAGNARFRRLCLWAILSIAVDMVCAVSLLYSDGVSPGLNMSVNTISFALSGFVCLSFLRYIDTLITGGTKSYICLAGEGLTIIYLIVLLGNFVMGYSFSFDLNGVISIGPGYYVIYILQIVICLLALVAHLTGDRDNVGMRRRLVLFYILLGICTVLQLVVFGYIHMALILVPIALSGFMFRQPVPEEIYEKPEADNERLLAMLDEIEAAMEASDIEKARSIVEEMEQYDLTREQKRFLRQLKKSFPKRGLF